MRSHFYRKRIYIFPPIPKAPKTKKNETKTKNKEEKQVIDGIQVKNIMLIRFASHLYPRPISFIFKSYFFVGSCMFAAHRVKNKITYKVIWRAIAVLYLLLLWKTHKVKRLFSWLMAKCTSVLTHKTWIRILY